MDNKIGMETSPLTKELYSIDWAVRFDEFRKFDQSSYTDLHQLLAKIENLVESENKSGSDDLNDIEVLRKKFSQAKPDSTQWHRLSMLINLKIILAAIPKGLTATATLSAIKTMEHMWKVLGSEQPVTKKTPIKSTNKSVKPRKVEKNTNSESEKPSLATYSSKKVAANTVKKKTPPAKASPASKTQAKSTSSKKDPATTENVVIKKLAAEAGMDDSVPLATRCYEVASKLADEYPEYTLTAIRVMTAEKLGVTRQYVENLDIKPARFKSM